MVAGEQQPGALLGEAEVARRVAGGVHCAQPPARQVGDVAVLQQPVGHGHPGELLVVLGRAHVLGRVVRVGAQRDQERHLGGDRGGRVAVHGGADELGVGRVHGHPRAGGLADPAGQPEAWIAFLGDAVCYADCNADGVLTVADFGCFQTRFGAGDLYADCNADGTLTVADFGCFQTRFVTGCP